MNAVDFDAVVLDATISAATDIAKADATATDVANAADVVAAAVSDALYCFHQSIQRSLWRYSGYFFGRFFQEIFLNYKA